VFIYIYTCCWLDHLNSIQRSLSIIKDSGCFYKISKSCSTLENLAFFRGLKSKNDKNYKRRQHSFVNGMVVWLLLLSIIETQLSIHPSLVREPQDDHVVGVECCS
jgi:hypothetical protein